MKHLDLTNESFIELETAFKAWLSALGYAATTVYTAPLHLRELLYYLQQVGIEQIEQTDKSHIEAFMGYLSSRPNQRRKGGLSLNHQAKYYQAIKNFDRYLKALHQWGFDLPESSIQAGQVIKTVFTQAEVQKLYQACENDVLGIRDRAMLAVFYGCGLRRSEGIGLDVEDVLLTKNLLYVRHGKNYRERYVPMSRQVKEDLQLYLEQSRPVLQKSEKEQAFFLSQAQRRIEGLTLSLRLKRLQRLSGDEALTGKVLTLHLLRHSVATHLLHNGMKLKQIALFLGHQSLESTQIYTHYEQLYE
jgi:integrase/recombinase XerD